MNCFLNFGVSGEAAETEADRDFALVEGEPNGVENAGGFEDAGRASAAGGCNESARIERRMLPNKIFKYIVSEDGSNGRH
jgi:hypothetical protein